MARLSPIPPVLLLASVAAFGLAPSASHAAAVDDCLEIDARPPDMFDQEARDKALKRWIEVCRQAVDAKPDSLRLKLALARAYGAAGQRVEEVALLRAAAYSAASITSCCGVSGTSLAMPSACM